MQTISPGWAIMEAGRWTYRAVHGQQPPEWNSVAAWLRWMGEWFRTPGVSKFMERFKKDGNRYWVFYAVVGPRLEQLAQVENRDPAYQHPEPPATSFFLGKDASGWALDRQEARNTAQRAFAWVSKEILNGRLDLRYLDLFLHFLVQVPEAEMRLPIPLPPCDPECSPESAESAAWYAYLNGTGFMDVKRSAVRSSLAQLEHQKVSNSDWYAFLQKAESVVKWASLQRPVEMLSEKVAEMNTKRGQIGDTLMAAKQMIAAHPDDMPAEYKAEVDQLERDFLRNEGIAYKALSPAGLWEGPVPSGLSGLGAIVHLTASAAAVVLYTTIAVVVAYLVTILTSAERTRANIAQVAMEAEKERSSAITAQLAREKISLQAQYQRGEITETEYIDAMARWTERKTAALAQSRKARENITDKANAGKGEGVLSPVTKSMTTIGIVGILGYLGLKYAERRGL